MEANKIMTQEERLDALLKYFLSETKEYNYYEIPDSYSAKRVLLRGILNVRMPKAVPTDILLMQDEFLKLEAKEKGIVTLSDIPISEGNISIWQGDITRLKVDVIVNAANSEMLGCFIPCHRCIDNAIHTAAGVELRDECNRIMSAKRKKYGYWYQEETGDAMLTPGFNLPAKYIIHTVGPICRHRVTEKNKKELVSCYSSSLHLAREHGLSSIAFPCISTGEFGYPNEEAAIIAIETVRKEGKGFNRIIFNVFKDLDNEIYHHLLSSGN